MCLLEKEQVILEQKLLQTLTRVVLIGSQSDLYEVGPTGIFLGHCGCVLKGAVSSWLIPCSSVPWPWVESSVLLHVSPMMHYFTTEPDNQNKTSKSGAKTNLSS